MLGNEYFFHDILRRSVSVFGTMFNDIVVKRFDSANNLVKDIRVPIAYAPKEKVLVRVDQDPNLDRPTAIELPRLSFEYTKLRYDGDRKLTNTTRFAHLGKTADTFLRLYTPVPYNINFNLYIYAKNVEDIHKIVEQILPFFTPDWTPTVHMIPEMDLNWDVPVVLNEGSDVDDKYEGNFADRKVMIHTMSFTMKTFLFGPVKDKKIIKFVKQRLLAAPPEIDIGVAAANNQGEATASLTTQPGLTANGQPTNVLADSIDPHLILATDDFGYVEIHNAEGSPHVTSIPGEVTTP